MNGTPSDSLIRCALDLFRARTGHLSDTSVGLSLSSAQVLMRGGEKTVRHIFASNIPLDVHLMALLSELTGANPVRVENIGYVNRMETDWREWAIKNFYL